MFKKNLNKTKKKIYNMLKKCKILMGISSSELQNSMILVFTFCIKNWFT